MADNEELIKIFNEEREKLNLSKIEIKVIFLDPPSIDYYESFAHWWSCFDKYSTKAIKNDDGSFTVQFNPLSYKSASTFRKRARHELYHIHKEGKNDKINLLRYLLINEPLAILYQYLGVKL